MGRLGLALCVLATTTAGIGGSFSAFSSEVTNAIDMGAKSTFAPIAATVPVVSGTIAVGNLLTATPGTWDNDEHITPTITYRWQYCAGAVIGACIDLPGTSLTYTISVLDLAAAGVTIIGGLLPSDAHFRVVETATNTWGAVSQASVIL